MKSAKNRNLVMWVHPRSCFFCRNCHGAFYYLQGQNKWKCDEGMLQDDGMSGLCPLFLESIVTVFDSNLDIRKYEKFSNEEETLK